jgi:hypothetical protein
MAFSFLVMSFLASVLSLAQRVPIDKEQMKCTAEHLHRIPLKKVRTNLLCEQRAIR